MREMATGLQGSTSRIQQSIDQHILERKLFFFGEETSQIWVMPFPGQLINVTDVSEVGSQRRSHCIPTWDD